MKENTHSSISVVKIKTFCQFPSEEAFFMSHIQSLNDYGSALWDSSSKNTITPLHSLHRRALNLILLKQSSLVYSMLHVLPLHTRLKYNKGIFMKKNMWSRLFPVNPTRDQIKTNIPTPCIDLFKVLRFQVRPYECTSFFSLKTLSTKLFKTHYLSYLTSSPW